MRTTKSLFLTLAAALFTTFAFAQFTSTMTGTMHDFSGSGWTTEICKACHTPHDGAAVLNAPLWNHDLSTTDFTLALYSSTTLDATVTNPNGNSRLCLSCHDGSIALDAFGGVATPSTFMTNTDAGYIGTSLTAEHPISFDYDAVVADPDENQIRISSTVAELPGDPAATIATGMLFAGSMECASCHDVHNSQAIPKLLVKSNTGSQLCLTCHIK